MHCFQPLTKPQALVRTSTLPVQSVSILLAYLRPNIEEPARTLNVPVWYETHLSVLKQTSEMFAAHDRYHYYYGQKVARLDRYQSLFDSSGRGKRTALAALLSPVLFNAPEVHLKSLERIWVDQIINEIPWSQFINKLQTDWQEAVLTVCRNSI